MSRVVTFSTVFPSYHPRKGEPTFFVEKMIQWYWDNVSDVLEGYHNVPMLLYALNGNKFPKDFYQEFSDKLNPGVNEWKSHTMRAGHRFKQGEFFKPCVWTGKPYRSLQMQFLPALAIPKTWNFEFRTGAFCLDGRSYDGEVESHHELLEQIATNDGLSKHDLLHWFEYPKAFDGQIICWNENINYDL